MIDLSLSKKVTASGLVIAGQAILKGFLIGTDGVNDPTITVFDNTSNSGEEIVPSTAYDASSLGVNGAVGLNDYCEKGIYVEISCAGAVEVSVKYTPYFPPGHLKRQG